MGGGAQGAQRSGRSLGEMAETRDGGLLRPLFRKKSERKRGTRKRSLKWDSGMFTSGTLGKSYTVCRRTVKISRKGLSNLVTEGLRCRRETTAAEVGKKTEGKRKRKSDQCHGEVP